MFDLSRVGAWADLPFFSSVLPGLSSLLETEEFYPPNAQVFSALELCQPEDCKVLILGQDPYHTPGKADGLAFSIPVGFNGRLDSLGNIFKEIHADLGVTRTRTDLSDWAQQGVLLLNTSLTVAPHRANAHKDYGWDHLVHDVVQHLSTTPIAALLWGGNARRYANRFSAQHFILESAHPSPLSAHRGFFGSRPFSRANQWLTEQGKEPIDWADP